MLKPELPSCVCYPCLGMGSRGVLKPPVSPALLCPTPEVLMFETEDLVLRKNVKSVVLCLLELGRRAWRFGVAAPALVHLEEEIDEELRRDLALPSPDPPPPVPPARRPCHFHNLDQMVRCLATLSGRARALPSSFPVSTALLHSEPQPQPHVTASRYCCLPPLHQLNTAPLIWP